MTDNEIIKNLKFLVSNGKFRNALWCKVSFVFLGNALDLINRQKAEIERLQEYHDNMEDAIYSFREDHAKVKFFKNEIRAEAIKEFAERLKDYVGDDIYFEIETPIFIAFIDTLVKETAGEE